MSRKKKVLVILHLCFAFAFLFWLVLQPYVKEVVTRKTEVALYEKTLEHQDAMAKLSPDEQSEIENGYIAAQKRPSPSFFHEIGLLFFVKTPGFALAWLFFSLLICFLILFHIEGARQAVWILPLLVVGYAFFLYARPYTPETGFFPKESYVTDNYLNDEDDVLGRRDRLQLGWHRYLISEWAKETPSGSPTLFQEQLDRGLFAFNIARLKWIQSGKGDDLILAGFTAPPSQLRVLGYLLWNFFFAWAISRRIKSARPSVQSSSATP